jgi:twitching motility protein PilT
MFIADPVMETMPGSGVGRALGKQMAVDIAQLLAFAVKSKASDLHLSAGVPPMIRVDGDVKRINMPALAHKDVHSMVYDIMNDKQRKDYEEFLETDFSFEIPKLARFRVNAYNQMRGAGAVSVPFPRSSRRWKTLKRHRSFAISPCIRAVSCW